ncbi:family 78 glycoside hydrolase catalytic domain [Parabacteroides sp. Marseille-P3160]|uniref:alpha-L-rhamnosidase-related protein n=1 Tax=Parabacteroides sp. Marseille-P3160 TaxID=1917887 RepID=UPI0009BC0D53|nr:family 78 glycoside hydrolase catalytic domain [Parabacteroides sp. Marseille-P3160]
MNKKQRTIRLNLALILFSMGMALYAQDFYTAGERRHWLEKAHEYTPKLVETDMKPMNIVDIVKDQQAFQGWKAVRGSSMELFYKSPIKEQSGVVVDFGEHMTGYFTFSVAPLQTTPDAPARFKFTFGEVPAELATPFDPYPGGLSRAWLQDEIVTVMTVPDTITIPRRLAFRYVKIELIAAPNYEFTISDMKCKAVTSVSTIPESLPATVSPIIQKIDKTGLNTLKECMQTVYEDGPKRDQRLWIGDLYLESMANNYSYKQYNLTQRCLYLLAGLADENGYLNATVFERPQPHPQAKQFLFEYALLYNVTLKDYLVATGDQETVLDLWPVAKRQLDIVRQYLQKDGMMDFERVCKEWWVFFDWKSDLYKEVALQGVSIYAFAESYELAKMIGKEKEVADLPVSVKRMKQAAHKNFYDKKRGLFVGTKNKQISYASQIWMILSGVASKAEGRQALSALTSTADVCRPGTPYLYHYYIQSMVDCGMDKEAKEALVNFWGGMIEKGADTFWEAYDPDNDIISPYNFYPMNSYCHAWSCTPVYFIRKHPSIFQ